MGDLFFDNIMYWLTGPPMLVILSLLFLLYLFDRQFIGLTPNPFKSFQSSRRLYRLKQELKQQPHNTSAKHEIARILMDKQRFAEALVYLEEAYEQMDDSAEVTCEIGMCCLKLHDRRKGSYFIHQALLMNPKVKYGEPLLWLGEAWMEADPFQAVFYLNQYRDMQSSSCEAHYRAAEIYARMGETEKAKEAYEEIGTIYRALPRYKKRSERRWMILAKMQQQ